MEPDPRRLLAAGCVVAALLAFLPPSGSADHLNYAAYGRLVTLGQDPYAVPPAVLPADPVTGAVEEWAGVTSVYGPVATAVQALASLVGGDSVRLTIFVMALVNAAAFIGTALLLHRFTRGDADLQRRAALLWTVNPLMIYHLSAGMHVDTLAIACMVAALMARGASSGLLLGVGIGVKLNAGPRGAGSGVGAAPLTRQARRRGRDRDGHRAGDLRPRRVARARPGRRGQQEGLSRHAVAAGQGRAPDDCSGRAPTRPGSRPAPCSCWRVCAWLLLRALPEAPAGGRRPRRSPR